MDEFEKCVNCDGWKHDGMNELGSMETDLTAEILTMVLIILLLLMGELDLYLALLR